MTAPAFEEVPMERMSPGIFKANLAMFPDPAGLYVRLSDARAYGDQRANAALEQAYDAMFSLKGDKVTRFDAQTAIRALKKENGDASQ